MSSKNNNKVILLILLTVFFSFLIFVTKNYFFWWLYNYENKIIEENYIEPQANNVNKEKLDKIIEDKLNKNYYSAKKIRYIFLPNSFEDDLKTKTYHNIINNFFTSEYILEKISFLEVLFYKERWEARWKMKNKKVELYGILNMNKQEFLAVWIHEFGHFIDLYYLEKRINNDISDYFYNISWETIKVIKSWQKQKDFVSWYSMTNKYEDFAETFVYYILHNSDFLEKSKKSEILKKKYDFMGKYLFRNKEFITNEYKIEEKIEDYYRDITKINFSLEKLLQYLEK